MRKFRHKASGVIADEITPRAGQNMYRLNMINYPEQFLFPIMVEQGKDWEEMFEEEKKVPTGIRQMKFQNGNTSDFGGEYIPGSGYYTAVKAWFAMGAIVTAIVDSKGRLWKVGDRMNTNMDGVKTITKIEWDKHSVSSNPIWMLHVDPHSCNPAARESYNADFVSPVSSKEPDIQEDLEMRVKKLELHIEDFYSIVSNLQRQLRLHAEKLRG